MKIERLQHTSIPMPPGGNDEARQFYSGIMGLQEILPPSTLRRERLVWFSLSDDGDELHLLTEDDFEPSKNGQHLCMVVDDVGAFREHLESHGVDIGEEPPIHHRPRFSFRDPFGNKVEITAITGDYLELESSKGTTMATTEPKITYTSTPEEIEAMHDKFDEALEGVEQEFGAAYPMIINGEDRTSDKLFDVVAPANTNLVLGRFPKGTPKDVDDAVAAAKGFQREWAALPWEERVKLVKNAANKVRERKFRLAAIMIQECGKSRTEAIGEIEEGAELLDYYADVVTQNNGYKRTMANEDPRERNVSVLLPFGVFGIMSPFNFPNALAAGPIGAALVTGNTVVFKPASATAFSGYELARAILDSGIPVGALHLVTGGGAEVGDYLVHHADTDGVVFTGSKETGMELYNSFSSAYPKPIIVEMGGKNPTIVTKNADMEKAVEGVAKSAFGFSGQKCSACSRSYVESSIYDEFMERLVKRTAEMKIGDPTNKDVYVGPVIDESAVERFEEAVEIAKRDGGVVRFGGERLTEGELANGTFVAPTIVEGLPLDHELFKRELFLPFIAVAPVDSLDQAIKESNDVEYGLTAGIFTEDKEEIDTFFNRIQAGVVYANRKGGATTGAWPGSQPFSGWKGSGSSGKGALGPYYPMLFLREQSRTVVIDEDATQQRPM